MLLLLLNLKKCGREFNMFTSTVHVYAELVGQVLLATEVIPPDGAV